MSESNNQSEPLPVGNERIQIYSGEVSDVSHRIQKRASHAIDRTDVSSEVAATAFAAPREINHLVAADFINHYLSERKIYNHLDRVTELLQTGSTFPVMMEMDPTNDCNHRCPDCSKAGNRFSNASLSLDIMKRAVDQTSSFLRSVVFTGGGEPLCNPQTLAAIKYAVSKGLSTALITNGELIDEKKAEDLVNFCEWIRISVDGYTPEEYLQIHGMDSAHLERVWSNVKNLVEAKRRTGSQCTLGAAYLVSAQNQENMKQFARKAKEAGVDYCQFRPFHYSDFDFADLLLDPKTLEDADFKVIASMHRIIQEEGQFDLCLGDNLRTILAADGCLYPCCFTRGREKFKLGDFAKVDFATIWNSDRKRSVFTDKLKTPNAPYLRLCMLDPLNKLLWGMNQATGPNHSKMHQLDNMKHVNFI
jgi:GTP 3',8-cyclase